MAISYMTMPGMRNHRPNDDVSLTEPPVGEAVAVPAPEPPSANAPARAGSSNITQDTVGEPRCRNPFIVTENVDVFYGDNHAIKNVTLEIAKTKIYPAGMRYSNELAGACANAGAVGCEIDTAPLRSITGLLGSLQESIGELESRGQGLATGVGELELQRLRRHAITFSSRPMSGGEAGERVETPEGSLQNLHHPHHPTQRNDG